MFIDNILQWSIRRLKTSNNNGMQAVIDSTLATSGGQYAKIINIPDTASVVSLYPSQLMRVALTELPGTISTATFVAGSILIASTWTTFALNNGLSRTLQFVTASSGNVYIDLI